MQNYLIVTIILLLYNLPVNHTSAMDFIFANVNFLSGIALLTTIIMTLGLIIDQNPNKSIYLKS